jgi:hypothetical protein
MNHGTRQQRLRTGIVMLEGRHGCCPHRAFDFPECLLDEGEQRSPLCMLVA